MRATDFAVDLLCAIADAAGEDGAYFRPLFDRRVALLRWNYYSERPAWAGADDFGIAAHTDDGCLTLLATDGSAGLTMHDIGAAVFQPQRRCKSGTDWIRPSDQCARSSRKTVFRDLRAFEQTLCLSGQTVVEFNGFATAAGVNDVGIAELKTGFEQ